MAYDCQFQATIQDHIPQSYLNYIAKEPKKKPLHIPDPKQMFVKKCMTPFLSKVIQPSPSSLLMRRTERNGIKHSIFTSKGDTYVGEWKDDNKHGRGTHRTHTGKRLYEGEWVNGKPEGYGVLCLQGEECQYNIDFEGFWKNGKPQGKGYHFYKDGSYYEGMWSNGIKHGYGKLWYVDGTYYEGYFYKNKRHGNGLFILANGNRYVGNWQKNEKHGFGAYYYFNSGQIQMGHWENNKCVNSWMIDMKYRQTVTSPTEFSIPMKEQTVKQFKRYIKLLDKKTDTKDESTQTDY